MLHIGTRSWEIWDHFGSDDCSWIYWCNLWVTCWDFDWSKWWNLLEHFWLTWIHSQNAENWWECEKLCECVREIEIGKSRTWEKVREDLQRRLWKWGSCGGAWWPLSCWVSVMNQARYFHQFESILFFSFKIRIKFIQVIVRPNSLIINQLLHLSSISWF